MAAVEGSPHDMTSVTADMGGACEYCHVPHGAKGERLWGVSPSGPETGWGSRPIAQLCYTCHNSGGGGYNASNVTPTAYSDLAHGYRVSDMPLQADGSQAVLPELPYAASGLLDCTTCHDPHSSRPPFLQTEDIEELCRKCHGRENAGLVGEENRHGAEEVFYSLHPTDIDYLDLPGNGLSRLHPFPDILQQETQSGAWRLGAHRIGWQAGSGPIGCQTCHPVHGGENYDLEVLPGPPAPNLLAIDNEGGDASLLCQACHQGGDPDETVGEGTDHPINSNDGDPATVFPEGWPSGTGGEVTCSSCHDAHGGMAGTSLMRQGGNTVEGWCFSCHGLMALLPPYHHSCVENTASFEFVSVITCGDCHGQGAGWTAHNGFEGFKVEVLPDSSSLCEICHKPEDPLFLTEEEYLAQTELPISFAEAAFPASHGRISGTDSHLINEFDDDSIENCQIKTTPWETSGGLSKYGPEGEILCESCHSVLANVGLLLGEGNEELLSGGWKTNLLLELYEDNSPGLGVEDPNVDGVPTLSSLCRGCHYSVQENVDQSFVHNPEAHTVIDYLYPEDLTPYGRESVTILTRPLDSQSGFCPEVSTADQMAPPSGLGVPLAPGAFSYPVEHVLDCDSCHRPHGADTDSSDDGTHRILDYTEIGQHGTAPCLECHDVNTQCGFEVQE